MQIHQLPARCAEMTVKPRSCSAFGGTFGLVFSVTVVPEMAARIHNIVEWPSVRRATSAVSRAGGQTDGTDWSR